MRHYCVIVQIYFTYNMDVRFFVPENFQHLRFSEIMGKIKVLQKYAKAINELDKGLDE